MDVSRDGSHTVDTEIEQWNLLTELLQPWQHKASKAGVHVERQSFLQRQFRQVFNRVHNAVAILIYEGKSN